MTAALTIGLLVVIAAIMFSTIFISTQIGKPRKVYTNSDIVAVVIVNIIIMAVLALAALKLASSG